MVVGFNGGGNLIGDKYWLYRLWLIQLPYDHDDPSINVRENRKRQSKNGQYRDTGNIGHKTQKTKINKAKTPHRKLKDYQHGPHQKPEVNSTALEGKVVPVSYKTVSVLFTFKSLCTFT